MKAIRGAPSCVWKSFGSAAGKISAAAVGPRPSGLSGRGRRLCGAQRRFWRRRVLAVGCCFVRAVACCEEEPWPGRGRRHRGAAAWMPRFAPRCRRVRRGMDAAADVPRPGHNIRLPTRRGEAGSLAAWKRCKGHAGSCIAGGAFAPRCRHPAGAGGSQANLSALLAAWKRGGSCIAACKRHAGSCIAGVAFVREAARHEQRHGCRCKP